MSRSSGTGQPLWFFCARKRKGRPGVHEVILTGRTKPFPGAKRGRMSKLSREYQCSCGHVGWSAHKDLEHRSAS